MGGGPIFSTSVLPNASCLFDAFPNIEFITLNEENVRQRERDTAAARELSNQKGRGLGSPTNTSVTMAARPTARRGLSPPPAYWENDDWEFPNATMFGKKEKENSVRFDMAVFRALPTEEEVEEATRDLQDALQLCGQLAAPAPEPKVKPTYSFSSRSTDLPNPPIHALHEARGSSESGALSKEQTELALDWPVKPPGSVGLGEGQFLHMEGRHSTVSEALAQLKCNPPAWGMFMSIATNKAVWDSVLADDYVQKFMRHYGCHPLDCKVVSANGRGDSDTFDSDPKTSSGSFILQTLRRTRVAVSQFMDSIMEAMLDVINGFLGLADKSLHAIGDPEGDPFNRTVKYCTVLAVLVLALVVVKRSSTVAQNASKVE